MDIENVMAYYETQRVRPIRLKKIRIRAKMLRKELIALIEDMEYDQTSRKLRKMQRKVQDIIKDTLI